MDFYEKHFFAELPVIEGLSAHMDRLSKSTDEIAKTSEQTGKIIKTIDEIAFQTNLPALNAAVEAARETSTQASLKVAEFVNKINSACREQSIGIEQNPHPDKNSCGALIFALKQFN